MLEEGLSKKIIAKISSKFNKKVVLKDISYLSGGCINSFNVVKISI